MKVNITVLQALGAEQLAELVELAGIPDFGAKQILESQSIDVEENEVVVWINWPFVYAEIQFFTDDILIRWDGQGHCFLTGSPIYDRSVELGICCE